jgi:hypothetical protein
MLTTPLRSTLDLRPPLRAVVDQGAAYVEKALDPAFVEVLTTEVGGIRFERMDTLEGRARQEGDRYAIPEQSLSAFPAIRELGDHLVRLVQVAAELRPDYAIWRPNKVHVQRYLSGDRGITPHRDYSRYRYLIAVFTVEGEAQFTICRNRAGDPLVTWATSPGSLVVLRAPGLVQNGPDDRPLHSIAGPHTGQRISITYRMDTKVG